MEKFQELLAALEAARTENEIIGKKISKMISEYKAEELTHDLAVPSSTITGPRKDYVDMSDEELKEYCKDYDVTFKFPKKMHYFDEKFPYAWSLNDRKVLIKRLEGQELAVKTLASASSRCANLKGASHEALQYGDIRNFTFYFRKEWLTNGNNYEPQYAPLKRLLDKLPANKRDNPVVK